MRVLLLGSVMVISVCAPALALNDCQKGETVINLEPRLDCLEEITNRVDEKVDAVEKRVDIISAFSIMTGEKDGARCPEKTTAIGAFCRRLPSQEGEINFTIQREGGVDVVRCPAGTIAVAYCR